MQIYLWWVVAVVEGEMEQVAVVVAGRFLKV